MDYVILGKNIKKFRQLKGLRQIDLAEMCNCSDSHIGQIENARGIPSLDTVVKISNALEEMVYLKEVSERIGKYPVSRRIMACEGLMHYLDSLEKFSQ